MSSTFAEAVKERFAGQLSEAEAKFCQTLNESLRATLDGTWPFAEEARFLWDQLGQLLQFNLDVDMAYASGAFNPTPPEPAKVPQTSNEKLAAEERAFLEDALGLIDWTVRNGVRFSLVLEALGHDVKELSLHHFSLQRTLADHVVPKVQGWAKRNVEPVGEASDQD